MEEKLKKYFEEKKPTGGGEAIGVQFLNDGKSSNHLNYKVVTSNGSYVARVTKPGDLLTHVNLADEYAILKYVENFEVGPRAISIDLEYFDTPVLIEEFVEGELFSRLQSAGEQVFQSSVDLMVKISAIDIRPEQFPFKYAYSTYTTSFKTWNFRLEEITKVLGENHLLVEGFKSVLKRAEVILAGKERLLQNSPKEFIYNDVYPGNLLWLPKEGKAKFIDWQKVSLGDPAFMIALFARRFGGIWKEDGDAFAERALEAYGKKKQINNLEELFHARLLERAVSDMIWVVWADIKRGVKVSTPSIKENKFYIEANERIFRI